MFPIEKPKWKETDVLFLNEKMQVTVMGFEIWTKTSSTQ